MIGFIKQRELEESLNCNIPWSILMDPTSACNLACTGCWAAEYGNQLNLTDDEMDSIIKQAKELGTYFFLFSGGEPLVRKADIIKLCQAHPDCQFTAFTNGTLRLYSLFGFQNSGKNLTASPTVATFHGLSQGSTLQRESFTALPPS